MERRRTTIGMAVDECLKEASEEWFRQHRGMRSREEAGCADILAVEAEVRKERGGFVRIIVDIEGRAKEYNQTDVWQYRLTEGQGYQRIGSRAKAKA